MKRFLVYEKSNGKCNPDRLWGEYYVDMDWYYVIILCICWWDGKVILRDTSAKWNLYDPQHAGTRMDKKLEATLLGKDSVVLRCAISVLCTCNICSIMYIWCCVHLAYMVLCACFIYSVMCMISDVVLGIDGAKYMFYM